MEEKRKTAGRRRKNSLNKGYNLANHGCGVIGTNSNCTDIKAYFIIKIILFIYLDFSRKISIIRTASRLHDL